ncbi:phosphatase [Legionella lytica]|uniref:Phosphatase n=1 Tax=Legionella lytica TaxID=96232 RepID=A0ABW8D871_9GAMM
MRFFFICCIFFANYACADTIRNYMDIANNIPQMEMKADPQAQAWARSARHVLMITSESIQETLIQANETAKSQGHPVFCLPPSVQLSPITLNELIQQTYNEISSQQSDKDSMTVSQVAWLGITKKYPCQTNVAKAEMDLVAAAWGGQQQVQQPAQQQAPQQPIQQQVQANQLQQALN